MSCVTPWFLSMGPVIKHKDTQKARFISLYSGNPVDKDPRDDIDAHVERGLHKS